MAESMHDLEREFPAIAGVGDLLQVAQWGVQIETQAAENPALMLLLHTFRQRARDALEQMLGHDLYAPDFTEHARQCIGEILRYRESVLVLANAILDGRQAHRQLQQAELRG